MPRRPNNHHGKRSFSLLFFSLLGSDFHALALSAPVGSISSSAASVSTRSDEILQRMQQVHEEEIQLGLDSFVQSKSQKNSDNEDSMSSTSTLSSSPPWLDGTLFKARGIGEGNAGIDAVTALGQRGHDILETLEPIVTAEECQAIVAEARATIAAGLADNNDYDSSTARTNSQLGEATLSSMPQARAWLQDALQERFYPLLSDRYGIDQDQLVLYDGLVLGANGPSRSQPIHRDASLLTINVALSKLDDWNGSARNSGGGTYFEVLDETIKIDRGHLVCHAGGTMHAGVGIVQGERWVLVLFVLAKDAQQIGRRCHAKALDCMQHYQQGQFQQQQQQQQQQQLQQQDTGETNTGTSDETQQQLSSLLDEAEHVLQTGLTVAPDDHLLHNTMARVHLARSDMHAALKSFHQADVAYPHCHKALITTAQILMDQRRPRAALRRFDWVLERIEERDLREDAMMTLKSLAWAARRDAARCALLCAEHDMKSPSRSWTLHHVPKAVDRIKTALIAAPNEPNLMGMLKRAEFLLEQAEQIGST